MRRTLTLLALLTVVALGVCCGGEDNTANTTTNDSANTVTTNTVSTPVSTPTPTMTPSNMNMGGRNANTIATNANTAGNANTSVTRKKSIDEILNELQTANIAYNTPEAMNLEETGVIELVLSPGQSTEELRKMVQAPGKVVTESGIKVSDEIEAELTADPTAFQITPTTLTRQTIPHNEATRWKWDVTPLKSGTQKLSLTINIIIDNNGKEQKRTIQTYERDILVKVSVTKRVSTVISNNWDWIWKVLVVPLAGAVVVLIRRQIKKRQLSRHKPSEVEIKRLIEERLTAEYKKGAVSDISFEFGKITFGTPTESYFSKDDEKYDTPVYPVRVPVIIICKRKKSAEKIERGRGKETFYFFKDNFDQWDLEIHDK